MLNFVYFTCHQRIIIIFKQELHLLLKQIFQKSLPILLPIGIGIEFQGSFARQLLCYEPQPNIIPNPIPGPYVFA